MKSRPSFDCLVGTTFTPTESFPYGFRMLAQGETVLATEAPAKIDDVWRFAFLADRFDRAGVWGMELWGWEPIK